MKPKILDIETINKYAYYDESSITFLRRNCNVYGGPNKQALFYEKHDQFGTTVTKSGYRVVCIEGKIYPVHRIIYQLFHGHLSKNERIDHIDGNKLNNQIQNLRKVTDSFNQRNRIGRCSKFEKSGIAGVHISKTTHKGVDFYYWRSRTIVENKKQIGKDFSIQKLGSDKAYSLAVNDRIFNLKNIGNNTYSARHIFLDCDIVIRKLKLNLDNNSPEELAKYFKLQVVEDNE